MSEMTTKSEKKLTTKGDLQPHKLLFCGLSSGLICAGIFNPWDRALYLSVKNDIPFLRKENFMNPFSGLFQTVFQRAISSGLYFPLEEIYEVEIAKYVSPYNVNQAVIVLFAGFSAGATNALLLNPMSSVKVTTNTRHDFEPLVNYEYTYF